jgi:hypothetical protein
MAEVSDVEVRKRAEEAEVEAWIEERAEADRTGRLLDDLGWLQIDTSYLMLDGMSGVRSTTSWQPAFLSRAVFVGIDTGWATGPALESTGFDNHNNEVELDEHWVGTFNWMLGVQGWHSWGGYFVRGLSGWRWDFDETDSGDAFHHSSHSVHGVEIGARALLFDSTVGLQASYGRFDDESDWVSIGFVSSLGYENQGSVSGILTGVQIFPVGLVPFLGMLTSKIVVDGAR